MSHNNMTRKGASIFKHGDAVRYIGLSSPYISNGGTYWVEDTHYDEVRNEIWVSIRDEEGEWDIYQENQFEHNKNRIVNDILNDL